MNKDELESIQQIANIHEQRIKEAIADVQHLFPLDVDKVKKFDKLSIYAIEMFTGRFAKLQDYLGNVVFDTFFEVEGENTETWTSIDKLNKLEKFGIIQDAHIWRNMRKSRNFLIHEYPDQPQVIADSLNVIYDYIPILLDIKNRIFAKIFKDVEK